MCILQIIYIYIYIYIYIHIHTPIYIYIYEITKSGSYFLDVQILRSQVSLCNWPSRHSGNDGHGYFMLARDGGGSFYVNLIRNFSGETRIPECQRLTSGAETLVIEVKGGSVS